MAPTVPLVLWAQRKDRILVSVQIEDVTNEQIFVDQTKLTFSGQSHGISYAIDLEFFNNIVPEESKQRKGGREFYFDLKKKESGPFWPRLLKDKSKHANIKVDFSRWKDEDESDDDAGRFDNGNLEDMMQQMGDTSLDPGEISESDSDDEEIPDLEDESGKKSEEDK
ncbi:prostaglandin E synthase 3 isoform X1 [Hydra vulgaris]|uniref:Prostaglandin E synthase 3 n=1 Tax=Hydra vulgaris TaxID=6087 RepID=T2MCW6_HYDVU|nr:prostaglandin E synthase 3 [Hydra vulgaris]